MYSPEYIEKVQRERFTHPDQIIINNRIRERGRKYWERRGSFQKHVDESWLRVKLDLCAIDDWYRNSGKVRAHMFQLVEELNKK